MTEEKIARINELSRRSKAEGLTEAEKQEQALLRQEYIADIRKNLRAQLDSIDMVNPDGTIQNLGEEHQKEQNGIKKYNSQYM